MASPAPQSEASSHEAPDNVDAQTLALQNTISAAISAAMGSMSTVIAQSVSRALASNPPDRPLCPPEVLAPHMDNPPQGEELIGVNMSTTESVLRSRKRAPPPRAERARNWKCARAQTESSDSEADPNYDPFSDVSPSDEEPSDFSAPPSTSATSAPTPAEPVDPLALVDPSGDLLFDPNSLHHPRSAEWAPLEHVSSYLEHWVRQPLPKETRSKLRAECPRPKVPNKVCDTPVVDPKLAQFLGKTGWNPRKGMDASLRGCQDKLLDAFGPLTKIFEMAESAKLSGAPIDPDELRGWVQRAICVTGNANMALSIERRRAILYKIDPKLSNLALTEAGKEAQGLLFGDSFIKELGRYVGAFTALDKAQSSMKRVFQGRVSARAGSTRGRLSGRSSFYARGSGRGSYSQRQGQYSQDHRASSSSYSFFPSRGSNWRSRPPRGAPFTRRASGY